MFLHVQVLPCVSTSVCKYWYVQYNRVHVPSCELPPLRIYFPAVYWNGKFGTLVEKRCSIFLSRRKGGSCSYRKNRQKKRNLNLHFGREFFYFRARVLRDEITFRHSKFLPNRDRALLECRPAESGYFLNQIVDRSSCPNCTSAMRDLVYLRFSGDSIFSSFSPSKIQVFHAKIRSRSLWPNSPCALPTSSLSREMGLLFRDAEFLPNRDRALLEILLFAIQACMLDGRDSSPPKS